MSVYVTEYERLARSADGPLVAAGQEPATANQKLTVGIASVASDPFNTRTTFVMVHTTEPVHLAFGPAPVAADTAHRLGAGETRFYGVSAGQRLAVIQGA